MKKIFPADHCPACLMPRSTEGDEYHPHDGDATVCLTCGSIYVYVDRKRFRQATIKDVATMPILDQLAVRSIQLAVRKKIQKT